MHIKLIITTTKLFIEHLSHCTK